MNFEKVFIRALTYHYTGRVVEECDEYIELAEAAWIADSGRFSEAMSEGTLSEVEPYPDDVRVRVFKANVVDVSEWRHPLPREV